MIHKNFILPQDKFYAESSYTNSYNQKNGTQEKPNQKFVPKGELSIGNNRFEGNSSYVSDFEGRGKAERAEKMILPKNFVMPEGKFEGDSSYASNYIPSKSEKLKKYVPQHELKVGGGYFEGASSYGADYNSKGVPLRADRVPLPKNHVLPEGKF